ATYRDIFGPGNYFLELMDHGLEIERRVRDDLLRLGKQLGLPPVVTNDSHYVREDHATSHDALLCVQTGSELSNPNRFRFEGSGYYLKSAAEMYGLDGSDVWQQGCRNTLLIAEMVDPTDMFEYRNLMPVFSVPDGEAEDSRLRKEAERGLAAWFPEGPSERHVQQLDYELKMIAQMGFSSYFLVVAVFIGWAR